MFCPSLYIPVSLIILNLCCSNSCPSLGWLLLSPQGLGEHKQTAETSWQLYLPLTGKSPLARRWSRTNRADGNMTWWKRQGESPDQPYFSCPPPPAPPPPLWCLCSALMDSIIATTPTPTAMGYTHRANRTTGRSAAPDVLQKYTPVSYGSELRSPLFALGNANL